MRGSPLLGFRQRLRRHVAYVDININSRACQVRPKSISSATMKRPSFAMTHAVRDTCLCLHAQRAARVLARRFDDALRPVGLTNGQFSLLHSLNRPVPARMAGGAAL